MGFLVCCVLYRNMLYERPVMDSDSAAFSIQPIEVFTSRISSENLWGCLMTPFGFDSSW